MSKSKGILTKSNIFLLVFLIIIIIIAIFSALNPTVGQIFAVQNWFDADELEKVTFWAAVGFVCLACFLGALVPIPIPYAIPISIFSAVWLSVYGPSAWGLIILLVIFGSIANTIGDLVDYMVGRGAEYILSQEDPELQTRWANIILKEPKAIPGIIFLFGLTPLPDSLLMVPLGVVEYDMKKATIWMFLGRFCHFFFFFAIAGAYAADIALSSEPSETGWIVGVVLLFIIWCIIVAMVKYKPKKE